MCNYILLLLKIRSQARGKFEPGIVFWSEFELMPFQKPLDIARTSSPGGSCLMDTFIFFYRLTLLWVYQHLSSCRSFIKYHLLQIFASFPLFSPLNHGLKERFTMHFSFMCILCVNHQEFPGLWGWHLNLHKNHYRSSCLMWSLKLDQRLRALLAEVILRESQQEYRL